VTVIAAIGGGCDHVVPAGVSGQDPPAVTLVKAAAKVSGALSMRPSAGWPAVASDDALRHVGRRPIADEHGVQSGPRR